MSLPPPTRRRQFLSRSSSSSRAPRRVLARLTSHRRPPPSSSKTPHAPSRPQPPQKLPHNPTNPLLDAHTSDVSDSTSNEPTSSPDADLLFIDDVPHIKISNVGEEEEPLIPDNASSFNVPLSSEQSNLSQHAMRSHNDRLLQENRSLQTQNSQLQSELDAHRARASTTSAELLSLTRQLADTRSKLNNRIRQLESELASATCATSTCTHHSRTARTRASVPSPVPTSPRTPNELPPSQPSTNHLAFNRVQSTGSVAESTRRRSVRHSASLRNSTVRRVMDADTSVASPATRARQSLIRRAFVAHIHAQKYRTARQAWIQFLGAHRQAVELSSFAACVRGLAVAAEASDRELQLLMQEICEVPVSQHTVMTWAMFSRFYDSTRKEFM
ncbi:hypothetical protein BWQ96_01210 [Gracilariopsis chorda]|uniref:Uncharacterized protein n=1 Tax=Gracilariopsis chorda TaxID=448386 RepID=A0A2V3J4M7_9FLOR|nr:hypothetical protein BWQ96_01210 [Gracilariopsis chorda]|eukprot:PXF49072.1 hypothetical protein BWQ96_01210 [Gracilariopsis chorda]